MSNIVSKEMAKAAAHWWAGKLAGGAGKHRTSGDDLAASLAGLMVDIMQETPSEEGIQRFEEILTKKILEGSKSEPRYYWASFGCDYAPDKILADSAKEAGVSVKNFPWKTFMHIEPDKGIVTVYDGYQSPWIQIWPEV